MITTTLYPVRANHWSGPLATLLLLGVAARLNALDWPQYRGPNHDGISTETIRADWDVSPPRVVWRIPLGPALSSFSVSGGKAFTQVRRTVQGQKREVCVALDAATGAELWATPVDKASYPGGGVGDDDGPRSTPSVAGDAVFVLTSYLKLLRLDAGDGHVVWSNDLVAAYGASVIAWQSAASPLLEGDSIFVNGNASNQRLMAFRQSDGGELWTGQNDAMTQATPIAATLAGRRQIVFFAQSGLVSVAPDTGAVLWRYGFSYSTSTGASPVTGDDLVYCSAAYGVGAGAVKVASASGQLKATQAWRTRGEKMNHWATPVHHNGYLYGVYGASGDTVTLRCLEAATGAEQWREEGVGMGGVLMVSGLVLVLTEDGYVLLVQPDPSGYREVARYRALDGSRSSLPGLDGKCWNVPAISNGRLYVRSTTEAVCLEVAPPAPPALRLAGNGSAEGRAFQLWLSNVDASPLEAARAANIAVYTTTNLALGEAGWVRLAQPLVSTNGQLLLEDTPDASARFYRVDEQP